MLFSRKISLIYTNIFTSGIDIICKSISRNSSQSRCLLMPAPGVVREVPSSSVSMHAQRICTYEYVLTLSFSRLVDILEYSI